MQSVTGSLAPRLKGTPTECHNPLDQADAGLCPTSLPEDMGSRLRPLAQEGHTVTRGSAALGPKSGLTAWTTLRPLWRTTGPHFQPGSPFPPEDPRNLRQPPPSRGEFRQTLAWPAGSLLARPAGSLLARTPCRKGRVWLGSASCPPCPFVCRYALRAFKEQVLDLGGISSRSWAPFLQGLSCCTNSLLLRRTTHVSRSCPLAPSGEGLCRFRC